MAEDILVETFTEAWRCAQKFRGQSRATTWMLGIARNLAMNELGKLKKHEDLDDFPHLSDGVMPDAEPMERKKILREAMSNISMKHREILDLVFFHEMTYQEISGMLGIPVSTVSWGIVAVQFAILLLLLLGPPRGDVFITLTSRHPPPAEGIKINVILIRNQKRRRSWTCSSAPERSSSGVRLPRGSISLR